MDQIPFVQAKWQTIAHRAEVHYVVVHTMELPCLPDMAYRLSQRFLVGSRKVSAHYCVDPGQIVQCVREENVAWHCPKANRRGIGVEHAGYAFGGVDRNFAGGDHDPTDWSEGNGRLVLRLSAELVAHICRRWDIPVRRLSPLELVHGRHGIIGHEDATGAFQIPGGHRDPGPGWPWPEYLAMVAEAAAALPNLRGNVVPSDNVKGISNA